MNKFKKFGLLFALSSLVVPTSMIVTSCNQEKVTELFITAKNNYVYVGESLQLSVYSTPISIEQDDVIWELVNSPDEKIKISSTGLLSISDEIQINESITVTVKATLKSDQKIVKEKGILVTSKELNSDFLGFLNNKIWYLDRAKNEKSVDIIPSNDGTRHYTAKAPIDFFLADDEGGAQPGYIKFEPIIKQTADAAMRFHIVDQGTGQQYHAFSWSIYEDNSPTYTIPRPYVRYIQYQKDTIEVRFKCDEDVLLTIELNAWQRTKSTSPGVINYAPGESDPHTVEPTGLGTFDSQLYCPAEKTEAKDYYTDQMLHVYAYRKPHEYLQYDRFEIVKTDNKTIADAINPTIENVEKITLREFDQYPVYRFDIKCEFDCNVMNAEAWDWESVNLFTLYIYDDFYPDTLACRCNFSIAWVE